MKKKLLPTYVGYLLPERFGLGGSRAGILRMTGENQTVFRFEREQIQFILIKYYYK